jgi:hypothetical protein
VRRYKNAATSCYPITHLLSCAHPHSSTHPAFLTCVRTINTRGFQVLGAYTPDLAFDGDNSSVISRWVSDIAYPQHWLAVDLGQLYLLEAVALVTG